MQSQGEARLTRSSALSQHSSVGHASFLLQLIVTAHVKCCLPEKLLGAQCPKFLFELITQVAFNWYIPKILDSQKESSINSTVHTNSLGTVSHFYQLGMMRTLLNSKLPDAT